MKLEPIIQSEVSQKDKEHYSILTHIHGIEKDGNDNPIFKTEKKTKLYRKEFWTLWEKARVGYFEGTACILSIVKQITSPGWMRETRPGALGRPRGIGWRERSEGGWGWGIHVTPWLIHVNV